MQITMLIKLLLPNHELDGGKLMSIVRNESKRSEVHGRRKRRSMVVIPGTLVEGGLILDGALGGVKG